MNSCKLVSTDPPSYKNHDQYPSPSYHDNPPPGYHDNTLLPSYHDNTPLPSYHEALLSPGGNYRSFYRQLPQRGAVSNIHPTVTARMSSENGPRFNARMSSEPRCYFNACCVTLVLLVAVVVIVFVLHRYLQVRGYFEDK